MIDEGLITKISQENNLDRTYVQLYFEEFDKIFRQNFCFLQEDVQKYINKIFQIHNEKALEYFYDIFTKYSTLDSSSKQLSEVEKLYRKKFAKDMIEKAFQLYTVQGKMIRDEFFDALKEAEAYGIDPYRISNKTTFKHLSVESFRESLKALMEETYIDTNSMKEFALFENSDDVKAMFEECSSLAYKFNSSAIQRVLELLSNFTYDKKNNVFFGNVNYVNMVRKCKKILTQTPAQLSNTIDFLTKYFTDENDPTTKQELVLKVNQDPTILLLTPEKVFALQEKLVSIGFSEEKAKQFCFNKDNLIQINGISNESISQLGELKVVLQHYLDKGSVEKALTRFEYINTKPVVLDIIFKRAIEEGVFAKFLQRPSALLSITNDDVLPSNRGIASGKKTTASAFSPLEKRENLTDEEKSNLQKLISKVSAKDKTYIESVIEKLKNIEKDDKDECLPRMRENKKPSTNSQSKTRRSKYIDDKLIKEVNSIQSMKDHSDIYKVFLITETCLDKIFGNNFCKRTFNSSEIRRNLGRLEEIKKETKFFLNPNFVKSFEKVKEHLINVQNDDLSSLQNLKDVEKYALSNDFTDAFKKSYDYARKLDKLTKLTDHIASYNKQILQYTAKKKNLKKENEFKDKYDFLMFNEAHLYNNIIKMVTALKSVLKTSTDIVLKPELLESVYKAKFNPILTICQYKYVDEANSILKAEKEIRKLLRVSGDNDMSKIEPIDVKQLKLNNWNNFNTEKCLLFRSNAACCCLSHMIDSKTDDNKLYIPIEHIIFNISNIEFDDKGIYVRHKNDFTFFYPEAPSKEVVETLDLKPATETTKALPKIIMTQDKVFDNIEAFDPKLFS